MAGAGVVAAAAVAAAIHRDAGAGAAALLAARGKRLRKILAIVSCICVTHCATRRLPLHQVSSKVFDNVSFTSNNTCFWKLSTG